MATNRGILQSNLSMWCACISIIVIIGAVFTYAASAIYALEKCHSAHYFLKRQIVGILLGLLGALCIQVIPPRIIKKWSPAFFWACVALTACTLIPGLRSSINGSQRWLNMGFMSFQPSELLKIAFILYIAYFIERQTKGNLSQAQKLYFYITSIGIPSIILLKQPDFGFTVVLATTALIMFFISHVHLKQLLMSALLLIPAATILIISAPYRLKRVLIFLNPWSDPQGTGFQIIQSLIAIGSGGLTGVGIGNSKQKFFYLPMQHTDFIFSIIAEETGFIGSCILITLFIVFLYFGIRIAMQMNRVFDSFVTLGFTTFVTLQTVINIAVATGMAPTKGVGLPFISYGNSALVTNLLMVGIIINLARNQ